MLYLEGVLEGVWHEAVILPSLQGHGDVVCRVLGANMFPCLPPKHGLGAGGADGERSILLLRVQDVHQWAQQEPPAGVVGDRRPTQRRDVAAVFDVPVDLVADNQEVSDRAACQLCFLGKLVDGVRVQASMPAELEDADHAVLDEEQARPGKARKVDGRGEVNRVLGLPQLRLGVGDLVRHTELEMLLLALV